MRDFHAFKEKPWRSSNSAVWSVRTAPDWDPWASVYYYLPLVPLVIVVVLAAGLGHRMAKVMTQPEQTHAVVANGRRVVRIESGARAIAPAGEIKQTLIQKTTGLSLPPSRYAQAMRGAFPLRWRLVAPAVAAAEKSPAFPYFDVDAACARFLSYPVRHDCVAREQRSFDVTLASWRDLQSPIKATCVSRARLLAESGGYTALRLCAEQEAARAERERRAREAPPPFDYRGVF